VVLVVAACSGGDDDVVQAEGPAGDREAELAGAQLLGARTLVVNLNACNGENSRVTAIEETADAVTVTARTDDPPGGDDCSDGVTVRLGDPLGVREVIDGSTGLAVEVGGR
jgi:hypothetical protein